MSLRNEILKLFEEDTAYSSREIKDKTDLTRQYVSDTLTGLYRNNHLDRIVFGSKSMNRGDKKYGLSHFFAESFPFAIYYNNEDKLVEKVGELSRVDLSDLSRGENYAFRRILKNDDIPEDVASLVIKHYFEDSLHIEL